VGSTRIHGELLMSWDRGRPINRGEVYDQKAGASFPGLEAFLRNHAPETASIDLFVVRTISFKLLYGLVILRHARRATGEHQRDPTVRPLSGSQVR
jgi:hypothetical protein